MDNMYLSLVIFTNASPCPKNQRGRKSGNHCQSWHFPTDGWHKRQISSSVGICRSRRLETNPLTNTDELSFGNIINVGGPRPNGLINTYDLSPRLAPFQFFRYPKLLPASGLWPSVLLLGFLFPQSSHGCLFLGLSLNAQSSEMPSLTLFYRFRKFPLLPSYP